MSSENPRIVIYGVGQFGQAVTRMATDKGWHIEAAFNRAGDKIGKDLGELSGIDPNGVIVQDCDSADYANLNANIGVVTATNLLSVNHEAHTRLLGAGINVVCHGSESYYPSGCDKELAGKLDALAKEKGVTFTGSGIWDMSRIWAGILVAGPCTEIHSMHHTSITDISDGQANKEQVAQIGVTMTVEQFNASGLPESPIGRSYQTIPEQVLTALGYSVTDRRTTVEPVVFEQDYDSELMECTIPAGDCVGLRIIAEIDTAEGVTATARIELRAFQEGEVEHMFWEVEGKPTTRVRTERDQSGHATAACLFNRIPDVIAARPGVVTVSELGPLKPSVF